MRRELQGLARWVNVRIGPLVPDPVKRRIYGWLFPPDPRKSMELLMDVVGSCNLRCPSCPVGNTGPLNESGLVDVELFGRVIEKAVRDYRISMVSLFNWAEPLLHPRLPQLIRIVRNHGVPCAISSNLNLLRNADEIFRAAPEQFRISLSGFTQDTYGRTHVRGQIERVKENMVLLASSKKRTGNTSTVIQVYYHKYLRNVHEVETMRAFAASLGFEWLENWAYYMPVERTVALVESRLPPSETEWVRDEFALPIEAALKEAQAYRDVPCSLLDRQIVLDLEGHLVLCCAVYDYNKHRLGNFLEMSTADLERAKQGHPTCSSCTRNGIHAYVTYGEIPALQRRFDALATERINQARRHNNPRSLRVVPE
jgi:MoaA/NifB/PqqE/SkfB family radical SAM enzyme